uniref:Uncharacterized protein n=1 Tax=Anguilla anguilla TaxID=7936 RepID=A0A0E9Q2R8_ANGAN
MYQDVSSIVFFEFYSQFKEFILDYSKSFNSPI